MPYSTTARSHPFTVDLWYGATADLEWYDPQQVTTRDGHLVITIDSIATAVPGLMNGKE